MQLDGSIKSWRDTLISVFYMQLMVPLKHFHNTLLSARFRDVFFSLGGGRGGRRIKKCLFTDFVNSKVLKNQYITLYNLKLKERRVVAPCYS